MLKTINNEKVKAIPIKGAGLTKPPKGAALFPDLYTNLFLLARTKSGKTSVIYKIIRKCCSKQTKIIAFVSTLYKDASWEAIQQMCKKKGIEFTGHTSLKDSETGVDLLAKFIKEEENKQPLEDDDSDSEASNILLVSDGEEDDVEQQRQSKYAVPEYLFIFDDLSTDLRSKSLVALLKKSRHFKAMVICSSQWTNDLLPEARRQLQTWLIFGGQSTEKLQTIYRDCDCGVDYDEFEEMYKKATAEKYNFFYVDTRREEYRKNFSEQFVIN